MNKYRIHEIKLKVEEPWENIPSKIEMKLSLKDGSIKDYFVIKESVDARNKKNIKLVYSVDFLVDEDIKPDPKKKIDFAPNMVRDKLVKGNTHDDSRPVVIGFGPCGMFAALELAKYGLKPIVIERGSSIENRVKDVNGYWKNGILNEESNVLFGEGGAGTFSDGKLTTGISDLRVRYVLETFVGAGAPNDILYKQKPHIGTDILRVVVMNIRKKIIELGGEIRFDTRLEKINILEGKLESIETSDDENIKTDVLVLAIGHSARDTFEMIKDSKLDMEHKPFSICLIIEHRQKLINKAQYVDEDKLPDADYKVSCKTSSGRGVYSFCMCPGGQVITTTTKKGELSVNGMSLRNRDSGTANSGLLCDVRCADFESDDVLAGVEFQRKYERLAFDNSEEGFIPPKSTYAEFINNEGEGIKVNDCLPEFASDAIKEAIPKFARKIYGFDSEAARLTAVETRSSSPVRILREKNLQSNIKGIYPAGEGAGYAGGITSAACDGLKVAEKIISE